MLSLDRLFAAGLFSRSRARRNRSSLIANIKPSRIYRGSSWWPIRLVLCFAQNEIEIWKRRKFRDQRRGLNQAGKNDILRLWQLRRAGAHDYHLSCVEWSSLAGI